MIGLIGIPNVDKAKTATMSNKTCKVESGKEWFLGGAVIRSYQPRVWGSTALKGFLAFQFFIRKILISFVISFLHTQNSLAAKEV